MEAFKKVNPENEDDILDTRYPRTYGFIRFVVYMSVVIITFVTWACVFLIACSCSPVITSHSGYVIHMDSTIIAVEHERIDKRGYGIVRYYPFIEGFEIGDCYGCR